MEIFFSPYTLTPLKRANRFSTLELKKGIHLKAVIGGQEVFADYYPHLPMGDRSCEQFLEEFKYQKDEYDQKILLLLQLDKKYQSQSAVKFKNHQLWMGTEAIENDIIKYKLQNAQDRNFLEAIEKGARVRLDANGMFSHAAFEQFIKTIPAQFLAKIEYIEDPSPDLNWNDSSIPCARDFLMGTPFQYHIYKPNCEFKPETHLPTIYSAYLGGDLGSWHAYCDLVENGDLSLTHGIIVKGFSAEEKNFYLGNYQLGFYPDLAKVKNIYQDLHQKEWKLLCKIST